MKKFYNTRKFKNACMATLLCVAVTCTGLASACAPEEEQENPVTYPTGIDNQTMKNGNFEYFNIPDDAVYLIKTPESWLRTGDSSTVMSGVISTSEKGWDALNDDSLAEKLDYNNGLNSNDENYEDEYVNYNGMSSGDLLYRDSYAASLDTDDVEDSYISIQGYEKYFGITEENGAYKIGDKTVYKNDDDGEFYFDSAFTQSVRHEKIANPGTHYDVKSDGDGKYFIDESGKRVAVYEDEKTGDLFYLPEGVELKDANENNKRGISNVLMIHNADTRNNGISQHYSSSTTINLQANTAAEISLWVKTSDLKFDKGFDQMNDENRGAFIEVVQTVSGTNLDSFRVSAINTQKILANNPDVENSNGWLKYTVYVNACDFAESTVTLNLGLGGTNVSNAVTGYAFFDDVTVTQYSDLDKTSYGDEGEVVSCTLTSEGDEKIFIADKKMRSDDADVPAGDLRYSENFRYLIDLASETVGADGENAYSTLTFNSGNVNAGLTTQEENGKVYISSLDYDGTSYKNIGLTERNGQAQLPKGMNGDSRPTNHGDIVGIFNSNYSFTQEDTRYFNTLNEALTGIDKLPKYKGAQNSNMLVMLSAYGAAYTARISDNAFTLGEDEQVIISFWLKTSDLNGKTAATIKVTDAEDDEKTNSYSVDTSDVTTDIGDEENIYNGWAQCFVYVRNETENARSFYVDVSFGNTTLYGTTNNSYNYGWLAVANMQTLQTSEKVFGIVNNGNYAAKFTMSDETPAAETGNSFADVAGTSNIRNEISTPSSYNGVNGSGSSVTENGYKDNFDAYNTNESAGLINRKYFGNYGADLRDAIANAFNKSNTDAAGLWEEVFGNNCYQPLIIVDNLRQYADNAKANETNYKQYLVIAEDNYSGVVTTVNGKRYREVGDDEAFDEDAVYYSINNVLNYGYIGNSASVAANGYVTVSVKVMVSQGATAYVYLVDPDTKEILGYSTPEYSYWYDDEGNVLNEKADPDWTDREKREHIVYNIRPDGLYEDENGTVRANLNNLTKVYDYYEFEHDTFFDEKGEEVAWDDLVKGETYYRDANKTLLAEHFLCSSNGTRVYEYVIEGNEGKYYYLVDEKRTDDEGEEYTVKVRSVTVENFEDKYLRDYEKINSEDTAYFVEIGDTNGKWVTVNFMIHGGGSALNYRLELWSGNRGEDGADRQEGGVVAFDYSPYSITQSNYSNLLDEYESDVISQYREVLAEKDLLGEIKSNDENIAYYEDLFDELGLTTEKQTISENYVAKYFTFSLYDSETFIPFNSETAYDNATGYNYTQSQIDETIAYFSNYGYDNEGNVATYNIFADYSAVSRSVDLNTGSDETEDEEVPEETESSGEAWLLISSIIIVIVLLFAMLSLLARELIKRWRKKNGKSSNDKNNYRKRERYIRKLHLTKTEDAEEQPEQAEPATEDKEVVEEPATEDNAAQPEEVIEETPAVEENAENETSSDVSEEGNQSEETPAESEKEDKE